MIMFFFNHVDGGPSHVHLEIFSAEPFKDFTKGTFLSDLPLFGLDFTGLGTWTRSCQQFKQKQSKIYKYNYFEDLTTKGSIALEKLTKKSKEPAIHIIVQVENRISINGFSLHNSLFSGWHMELLAVEWRL